MRLIRRKTFETNSSSTHALGIYKLGKEIKYPKNIKLGFGDFGWDYHVYYNTEDKAKYILTLIFSMEDDRIPALLTEFYDFLDYHNIEYQKVTPKKNFWGDYDIGYVDHSDEASDWLEDTLNDDDKLSRFLFDKNSYVSTGNDNGMGYYIPQIGTNENYEDDEFNKKIGELSEYYDIFFKGN